MARSGIRSLRFGARRRDTSTSVLLVALGAVAGVALGMVIADRAGGIDGLLKRGGSRGPRRPAGSGWRGDETRSEPFDSIVDDDSELSPESIAHMHVHGALAPGHAAPHEGAQEREGMGAASGAPREATRTSVREGGSSRIARRRGRADAPASPGSAGGMARDAGVRPLPLRTAPDDAALEARVLEAFLNDPTLQERAIDICAAGPGAIELTGWVQASWEIGHALTLARGVPDVHRVVDRLAVRGGEPARDHSSLRYAGPPPGTDVAPRAD